MQLLKTVPLLNVSIIILSMLIVTPLMSMKYTHKKTKPTTPSLNKKSNNKIKLSDKEQAESALTDSHSALMRIKILTERAQKIQSSITNSLDRIKQQIACYKETCILYNKHTFKHNRKETFARLYRAIGIRVKLEAQNKTAAAQ